MKIHQINPETGAILRTIEGSTESLGTAPGKATKATCVESIPGPARSSSSSTWP
jgi:hypothetical protein